MLPPLEVNTVYRAQDFEYLEFSAQGFHRQLTGEDTAILRLRLANATILEIPVSDEDLRGHMRLLMSAYPADALNYAKSQKWI
jgi:hypothetical protein